MRVHRTHADTQCLRINWLELKCASSRPFGSLWPSSIVWSVWRACARAHHVHGSQHSACDSWRLTTCTNNHRSTFRWQWCDKAGTVWAPVRRRWQHRHVNSKLELYSSENQKEISSWRDSNTVLTMLSMLSHGWSVARVQRTWNNQSWRRARVRCPYRRAYVHNGYRAAASTRQTDKWNFIGIPHWFGLSHENPQICSLLMVLQPSPFGPFTSMLLKWILFDDNRISFMASMASIARWRCPRRRNRFHVEIQPICSVPSIRTCAKWQLIIQFIDFTKNKQKKIVLNRTWPKS